LAPWRRSSDQATALPPTPSSLPTPASHRSRPPRRVSCVTVSIEVAIDVSRQDAKGSPPSIEALRDSRHMAPLERVSAGADYKFRRGRLIHLHIGASNSEAARARAYSARIVSYDTG